MMRKLPRVFCVLALFAPAWAQPTSKPATEHKEIALDAKILQAYVGKYQLRPGIMLTVTLEAGHLYTQLTGQQSVETFPETEHDFFVKVVNAQWTFHSDAQGKVTDAVLHQNGREITWKRVAEATAESLRPVPLRTSGPTKLVG